MSVRANIETERATTCSNHGVHKHGFQHVRSVSGNGDMGMWSGGNDFPGSSKELNFVLEQQNQIDDILTLSGGLYLRTGHYRLGISFFNMLL